MNQLKRKYDDGRLRSLQCPVCLNLAFDAVVNTCGHTVCEECSKSLTKCPECRAVAKFNPNFMVRTALANDTDVHDEYAQFRHNQLIKTPAGFIAHIKSKYPDMTVEEYGLGLPELACIYKWIDSRLTDSTSRKDEHPFGPQVITVWTKKSETFYLSRCKLSFKCNVLDYTIMVGALEDIILRDDQKGWEEEEEEEEEREREEDQDNEDEEYRISEDEDHSE